MATPPITPCHPVPAPHPQGWLKLLYTSRCKKYEQGSSMEATLEALENEPPNRQAAPAQQQQQQQQPHFRQQQIAAGAGGGASLAMQTPSKAGVGLAPMALSPVHEEEKSTPQAAAAAAAGWGLHDNLDVIACRAEWLYHRWGPRVCGRARQAGGGATVVSGAAPALMSCAVVGRRVCRRPHTFHHPLLPPSLSRAQPCPRSPASPLRRGAYAECYTLTASALERDPYATECLPVHLASALELRKKNELFIQGHK